MPEDFFLLVPIPGLEKIVNMYIINLDRNAQVAV